MKQKIEWDPNKAVENFRKHGVTFEEGVSCFEDPYEITRKDESHSVGETRYLTIGHSDRGNLLVISFTERDERTRIISVRKTTRRERHLYENFER